MSQTHITLFSKLQAYVDTIDISSVSGERKKVLEPFINYIQNKKDNGSEINLNFICTHNSRRSQLSQVWGKTAAAYFGYEIKSFSGGVEVTVFNERAVECLKRAGFEIQIEGDENPHYSVYFAEKEGVINTFSKVFDDPENKVEKFAAIMTCSHADENCPFIPGAEVRLPVRYEDPKAFDGTPQEAEKYDERSKQIATELFYVFSKIS
ncbi:MAG: arsenate reductase [Cyclobacteriaceae bacterium]|jgi:arsenate reductase